MGKKELRVKLKILFVHCHPDDETITNGLSIAKFIKLGHDVTVINFSGGESGYSYLENFPPNTKKFEDKLLDERLKALSELNVFNHMFIGPYHDAKPNSKNFDKKCLINQNVEEVASKLSNVIIDIKPDIVITYDSKGWSGHPDHIKVHDIVLSAIKISDKIYEVPNIWFTVILKKVNPIGIFNGLPDPFWVSEYDNADIELDCSDVVDKKKMALLQYETQIKVYEDYWTLVGMDSYKVPHFDKEWFNIYRGKNLI